jgi:hypothetical protein
MINCMPVVIFQLKLDARLEDLLMLIGFKLS